MLMKPGKLQCYIRRAAVIVVALLCMRHAHAQSIDCVRRQQPSDRLRPFTNGGILDHRSPKRQAKMRQNAGPQSAEKHVKEIRRRTRRTAWSDVGGKLSGRGWALIWPSQVIQRSPSSRKPRSPRVDVVVVGSSEIVSSFPARTRSVAKARGLRRVKSCALVGLVMSAMCQGLFAPCACSQAAIPRGPGGLPDLQGRWTMRTLTPFFRPEGVSVAAVKASEEPALIALVMSQRLAAERLDPGTSEPDGDALAAVNGEYRTSAIVAPANGQMALTAAGEARLRARTDGADGPEARPVNERCIADAGRAPYRVMSGEMYFEIIQTSDYLVIHKEGMDPPRIFPLARTPSRPVGKSWTGSSTSHWDGDTFVIETMGFRPDDTNRRISGPGAAGFPIAPDTRVTEWLIPVSAEVILYRYKIDDTALYVAPLVIELPLVRTSESLFESACHEGNISLANTLRGARRAD